jgi:hypothetical protein
MHKKTGGQRLWILFVRHFLPCEGASMKLPNFGLKPLCSALVISSLLTACGGGGGNSNGDTTGGGNTNTQGAGKTPAATPLPDKQPPTDAGDPPPTNTPPAEVPSPPPVTALMTMECAEGAGYQCSGDEIIRRDNGVALTRSGVQAYGRSTSDLVKPTTDPTLAFGLQQASGGTAEFRLAKDANGVVSKPALLLKNLGLSWDGTTERPQIIDTFDPTAGRVEIDGSGLIRSLPLPPTSDMAFYDYRRVQGGPPQGTQAHYANNRYFPRDPSNPPRCAKPSECSIETKGMQFKAGDWSSGGRTPDFATAVRLHGEGDIHAGDSVDANGKPTWHDGGTGFGVPFPGSKGYRGFDNWSYRYGNLGAWVTQDTVFIHEWGAADEHTKMRRGIVAFGDVTPPSAVPATGSAKYSGIAYGWHASNGTEDPTVFWGAATVTVDFATRIVKVEVENSLTYDAAETKVPAATFTAFSKMGAASESVANYLTGPVDNGAVKGGVSGRYFGPVTAGGPAEVGGAFTLSAASGQTVIGGFIARKQ